MCVSKRYRKHTLNVRRILLLDQKRALRVWADLAGKAARLFILVRSLCQGELNPLYMGVLI